MGNSGDRLDQYVIGNNTTDWASTCSSVASDDEYAFWTAGPWLVVLTWLFLYQHYSFRNVLQAS
jgi:hypothetical protein